MKCPWGFVLVVGALACGPGVSTEPEKESGIPLDELSSRIADAWCPKVKSCCPMEEDEFAWVGDEDLSFCRALVRADLGTGMAPIRRARDEHRVVYRGDRAEACLERFSAAGCVDARAQLGNEFYPCWGYLDGQVALGQFCLEHYECKEGYCDEVLTGNGRCRAKRPLGAACEENAWCESGGCVRNVCAAPEILRLCPVFP